MSEFKQITGIDNQPYYSFFHNGQEYFIWIWLSDGGPDIDKACLAIPNLNTSGQYTPNNVLTESAYSQKVELNGGTKLFMKNLFLPKVNEYLAAQGGGSGGFPEEGHLEQFNWLVENSLSYDNGVVSIDF